MILQKIVETLRKVYLKVTKKTLKKQLNLLPKAYLESYKVKRLVFKIATIWVAIFLSFIFISLRIKDLSVLKANSLDNILSLQQNYIEANELLLNINNIQNQIDLANDMLNYLGSENDYKQYIELILGYISLFDLLELSFNTNEMAVNLTIIGKIDFLPIVMENLYQDSSFYDIVIRNSVAEGLNVRFTIEFSIKENI